MNTIGATWLRLLFLDMQDIKEEDYIQPRSEMDKREDHEVGVLSDDLKKIFTLWKRTEKAATESLLEARYSAKDEKQADEAINQAIEKKEKADLLQGLFWISLKDEFGLWDKGSVGVAKGFKAYYSNAEKQRGFFRFLRGFPGFPDS